VKRAGAVLGMALLVAACGGSALPPPAAGDAPTSAPASAAATSGESASSGAPSGGGGGAAASAPAGFSAAQAQLFGSLRSDARVGCVPRTDNLPAKATAGIECTIGSNLVERVGVYAFATPQDALAAYISRMASYHVALRTGDCRAGKAGDVAWTPGDGPDEGGDQPWRTGCFLDENGTANVRTICGLVNGTGGEIARYIGVLGAAKKIKPLLDWTEAYEDGAEQGVPSPPGICVPAG
jgi:hypothetical protein